jgi:glycosyltransferase involved in cell wall biosynthesis
VVTFTIKESMMNAGDIIDVTLGGQVASVQLSGPNQEVELKFDNVAYTDDLRIRGLDAKSPIGSQETRLLGLALSGLSVVAGSREADLPRRPFSEFVSGLMARKRRFFAKNANSIAAASVVYTTVFNPIDGRKNWPDIIKAFVFALRENAGALLIVKITHSELQPFLGDLCSYLVSMAPFQCRIVFLHGYLDDDEYQNLIRATSFIVNASKGEGQCLPLMEFMSSGVPAIAPDNTAMSDYISSQNAFVVKSSIEPAVWPQDPRLLFRTTRYRINWESLYDAFKESYRLAVSRKQDYALMSKASIAALQQYCSMESATERMREFLGSSGPGGAG